MTRPEMKNMREEMRKAVKAGEQDGVGVQVNLFDYVDGLDTLTMMAAVSLREESQSIVAD